MIAVASLAQRGVCSGTLSCGLPVDFPSVERFGVESDGGRVPAFGTVDSDLSPEFHPRHRQDGAGVGTGQSEHVLLIVLQQIQHTLGDAGHI